MSLAVSCYIYTFTACYSDLQELWECLYSSVCRLLVRNGKGGGEGFLPLYLSLRYSWAEAVPYARTRKWEGGLECCFMSQRRTESMTVFSDARLLKTLCCSLFEIVYLYSAFFETMYWHHDRQWWSLFTKRYFQNPSMTLSTRHLTASD